MKNVRSLLLFFFALLASAHAAEIRRADILPEAERRTAFGSNAFFERRLSDGWRCGGVDISATPFARNIAGEIPAEAAAGFTVPDFWKTLTVPHDLNRIYKNTTLSEKPYQRAWYRLPFSLTAEELAPGRVLSLECGAISYEAEFWLNGVFIASHKGSFTPFSIPLPRNILRTAGEENVLAIRVHNDIGKFASNPIPAAHTYGSQWFRGNYRNGINRCVSLRSSPAIALRKMRIQASGDGMTLSYDARLEDSAAAQARKIEIQHEIYPANRSEDTTKPVFVSRIRTTCGAANAPTTLSYKFKLPAPAKSWDVAKPYLYDLVLTFFDAENPGMPLAVQSERFGFRTFEIADGKFFLNNRECYIFGQNAYAADFFGDLSDEAFDAKAEKQILSFLRDGYNLVRTAHQPIPGRWLEIADECGLPVYHEWSWCFTANIAGDFGTNSERELREFVAYSHNHPSVCAWSLGNELPVFRAPEIGPYLDRFYELVRELDLAKRPICSFSGVGERFSDNYAVSSDFLDFHLYTGLSEPWGIFRDSLDRIFEKALQRYPGKAAEMPMVAYELVGFSWGNQEDKSFEIGDREAYERYLSNRSVSWGAPQIAGFLGCTPAHIATKPQFVNWARNTYGRRIFEESRLDERFAGFAPWFFDATDTKLWTQPVMPILRTTEKLPPRNLFSATPYALSFTLAPATTAPVTYTSGTVTLSGQNVLSAPLSLPSLNADAATAATGTRISAAPNYTQTISVRIP